MKRGSPIVGWAWATSHAAELQDGADDAHAFAKRTLWATAEAAKAAAGEYAASFSDEETKEETRYYWSLDGLWEEHGDSFVTSFLRGEEEDTEEHLVVYPVSFADPLPRPQTADEALEAIRTFCLELAKYGGPGAKAVAFAELTGLDTLSGADFPL